MKPMSHFIFDHDSIVTARVPLLAVNIARRLFCASDPGMAAIDIVRRDRIIRAALFIGSPSFYAELLRSLRSKEGPSEKLKHRTVVYLLRMSCRSTPFGMFASVGRVHVGEITDLTLSSDLHRYTLPDSSWLESQIDSYESHPDHRMMLTGYRSDNILETEDRLFVSRRRNEAGNSHRGEASSRASLNKHPAVSMALDLLRNGERLLDVSTAISEKFIASRGEAQGLINNLWDAGLIFSSLRPSPLSNPLRHLIDNLPKELIDDLEKLRALSGLLDKADNGTFASSPYRKAVKVMQTLEKPSGSPLYTIFRRTFKGTLSKKILDDAAQLASYLTYSTVRTSLAEYKSRFLERYGFYERRVPLLELVDPDFGIGRPPSIESSSENLMEPSVAQKRLDLAFTAFANGVEELDLESFDSDALKKFLGAPPPNEELPSAIEFCFQISARSTSDLEAGAYLISPSGFLASEDKERVIGRFLPVFDEKTITDARLSAARDSDPNYVLAELVLMPKGSNGNVTMRRSVTDRRIEIQLRSHNAGRIELSDLEIFIDENKFVVWSKSLEKRVKIRETHVYRTSALETGAAQFLSMLAYDGIRYTRSFEWGPAATLPVLPRVRHGRLVISPRMWRLGKDVWKGVARQDAVQALGMWASSWNVPKLVQLREYDRLTVVSLGSETWINIVLDMIRNIDADVIFQECSLDLGDAWLSSHDGSHMCEVVAALRPAKATLAKTRVDVSHDRRNLETNVLRFVDDQWVFAKFYIGSAQLEPLLKLTIAPFIDDLTNKALIDRWFFIRYADPSPHLRVRIRVQSKDRFFDAFQLMHQLAQGLLKHRSISRYSFEPYEREIERYGGSQTYDNIEQLFEYDSVSTLNVLKTSLPESDDRVASAIVSFDSIMLALLNQRERKDLLSIISNKSRKLSLAERTIVKKAASAIHDRRDAGGVFGLDHIVEPILRAHRSKTLATPPVMIVASLLHMHLNRLGFSGAEEQRVNSLIWQTYRMVDYKGSSSTGTISA